MSENYGDNRWATFKQMEEKGWTFKKTKKATALPKEKARALSITKCEIKKRKDVSIEVFSTE